LCVFVSRLPVFKVGAEAALQSAFFSLVYMDTQS